MFPNSAKLSAHLRYFFTAHLPQHRAVSSDTRLSYKDSFIQLLRYWKNPFPTCLDPTLDQFSVPLLLDFLTHLEKDLGNRLYPQHPSGGVEVFFPNGGFA
jgi:hypothetical protein